MRTWAEENWRPFVETLDLIGIQVGSYRLSIYSVLTALIVIALVLLTARLASRYACRLFGRINRLDATQQVLGQKMISIIVWVAAFFIGIDILGIDLTALAVFSGAVGLAVGFGLQKTFGNLIAGIILLMDRSIKPGDVISVTDSAGNESFGQIRKIGIRAVSVMAPADKREYLIPNENLMINQVENWSYSSRDVRMQVNIGVSYNCNLDLAEKLMIEAAKSSTRVLTSPPPAVWLKGFGDSSVDFTIQCWILDPEQGVGNVRSDVLKQLWKLFQEHGIEIPFPQRDINLRDNAQFKALLEALRQRDRDKSNDEGSA